MGAVVDIRGTVRTPLRTPAGEAAYRGLLRGGPLARIFADKTLLLRPAKGGSGARFRHLSDQSSFAHALSVATVAGCVYESILARFGEQPDEREMRILLAAGALHDLDKMLQDAGSLGRAFQSRQDVVLRLVDGYVPAGLEEAVAHFALQTEGRTSWDAPAFQPFLPGKRPSFAAHALNLADALAGHRLDPMDPRSYLKTVEDKRRLAPVLPEIHVQALTHVPQVALARAAREVLMEWARDHGWLLHESEAFVSWIGPALDVDSLHELAVRFAARTRGGLAELFEKHPPSHNSLRINWTADVEPTPEVVRAWIERWGGRLVLWEGAWGVRHYPRLREDFGPCIVLDRGDARVRVQVPEDSEGADPGQEALRLRALLLVAHTVHERIRGPQLPVAPPPGYSLEGAKGAVLATVAGILSARTLPATPEAFQEVCLSVSKLLLSDRKARPDPARGFYERLLGHDATTAGTAPTDHACIYCAAPAKTQVREALVFGIKPTAWAPRKSGVQRESSQGVICNLCILENRLRHAMLGRTGVSRQEKELVSVHLHAADLVADAEWRALTALLEHRAPDEEGRVLIIPKGQTVEGGAQGIRVPLLGHVSIQLPRPRGSPSVSETRACLHRLRDLLAFVRDTGFKIQASPLYLVPKPAREAFVWENAPGWLAAVFRHAWLGPASRPDVLPPRDRLAFRLDEIERALEVTDALLAAGRAVKGSQGHRTLAARLLKTPLAIYIDAQAPEIPDNPIHSLESAFMSEEEIDHFDRIADAYVRFNKKESRWSNNHWTWATRQYLDERERLQVLGPGEAWRAMVVGRLRSTAARSNPYLRGDELIQHVETFAREMEAYLERRAGGRVPAGLERRALIDAIDYRCRKIYRDVFPKSPDPKPLEA